MKKCIFLIAVISCFIILFTNCKTDLPDLTNLSSDKKITEFAFSEPAVAGIIDDIDKSITVTVPFGTTRIGLIPIITYTGVDISPKTDIARDFSNPLSYTVRAEDGSEEKYTVSVSVAPSNETVSADSAFIQFDSDGGSPATHTIEVSYPQTTVVNMPTTPTKTGYTFDGWWTEQNGEGTQFTSSSTVNGDKTVYAKWIPNTYTVTLDAQEGNLGSSSVEATFNSAMPIATPPTRDGYFFNGYYLGSDGSGTQYYSLLMESVSNWDIDSNTTLYAKWTANTVIDFLNLSSNGISGSETTTTLTLSFSDDPTTLQAADITLTGATKETLTGSGATRYLTISDISVANSEEVSVDIANPSGYTISPFTLSVPVYLAPQAVSFSDLYSNGSSGSVTTTILTLTFSEEPITLTAADITLTGATKGTLSGTGTTRYLAISAISVANGEDVTIGITNPEGFLISPSSLSAPIYKDTPPPDVTNFTVTPGSSSLLCSWTPVSISDFDCIKISWVPHGGSVTTEISVRDMNQNSYDITLNLNSMYYYDVIIKVVDTGGNYSDGILRYVSPN